MNDLKLGELITNPEQQQRDAIHIAVMPVKCGDYDCEPGTHVGLDIDGRSDRWAANLIGVIDPFLKAPVPRGAWCWLFLYPNTITSLRHLWTHPGIPDGGLDAKTYLERVAVEAHMSYDGLIEAGKRYIKFDEPIHLSVDNPDIDMAQFWKNFSKVTGIETDESDGHPFTCSC